jgi:hypothetical protein
MMLVYCVVWILEAGQILARQGSMISEFSDSRGADGRFNIRDQANCGEIISTEKLLT